MDRLTDENMHYSLNIPIPWANPSQIVGGQWNGGPRSWWYTCAARWL